MSRFAWRWCLGALLAVVSIARPEDHGRTFASMVGLNVKFSQGESMRQLPLLTDLGVHWVRDTVDWPTMEPEAGRYLVFPRDFAARLAFYKTHDIGVIFGLWYDNPKAYPNTPDDPHHSVDADAYGRYAAEIAKLLKASGVRFVIELYNEPHNSLKDLGGTWTGHPPAAWLDHYVEMVRAATTAVKAFDPGVRLLVDDDMWIIHYWFLEKGLPAQIDGLAVHPYVKNWPEFSAVEQDTSWTQPFDVVDADRSFTSSVRQLRDRASEKLGHTPAIWITEWGWPIGEEVAGQPLTEETLAGMLPRAYITAADAGAEALCWFSIQDNVDGPMGLLDNNDRPRKTYLAFKTMIAQLGPATAIKHVSGADHPTCGVQAYRFTGVGINTWVVWDIDGNTSASIIDLRTQAVKAFDIQGKTVQLKKDKQDWFVLPLSRSPVYLTNLSAMASLVLYQPAGVAPAYLFP